MEDWQLDFEWLRIKHEVKDAFGKDNLPDMQAILFLIGVQELGIIHQRSFSKEEKQDLMHIAVCTLLEDEGYYEFKGRDQDGWPHWSVIKPFKEQGVENQEKVLKKSIIKYFKSLNKISQN